VRVEPGRESKVLGISTAARWAFYVGLIYFLWQHCFPIWIRIVWVKMPREISEGNGRIANVSVDQQRLLPEKV
jgi:hypothetical protein